MAKNIEKECACKAAEELSAEDVENIAGGIVPPVVGSADGASDVILNPAFSGKQAEDGWKDAIK
ncbi:MAG: hypothetical protein HUJ65_07525 [Oscillospiraceae bacterium]|nr:hypothetical protein [Oscillospiraceae bacterium]